MGVCASKPAEKGESEAYPNIALAPGVTADIRPGLEGAKSSDPESIQDNSDGLPIAKDSYGAEEVQKPRSARVSLDAHQVATASAEGALQEGRLPGDTYEVSASDLDDPELLKEYTRLAEMLRYSPYPVGLIAIEEDNQPYVFVNNVSCWLHSHMYAIHAAQCFNSMRAHEAKCKRKQLHLQVFCERLGFIDTDVVGKSW